MFESEQEMSVQFERFLKTNFGNAYIKEQQGLFGVPDFVCYAKQKEEVAIVSFELKLKNWRQAAKQAFKYRSFSNISYVVLSVASVSAAKGNIEYFRKYNIGLALFDTRNEFEILYKPSLGLPYSENLNRKLVKVIGSSRKKVRNIESLVN